MGRPVSTCPPQRPLCGAYPRGSTGRGDAPQMRILSVSRGPKVGYVFDMRALPGTRHPLLLLVGAAGLALEATSPGAGAADAAAPAPAVPAAAADSAATPAPGPTRATTTPTRPKAS